MNFLLDRAVRFAWHPMVIMVTFLLGVGFLLQVENNLESLPFAVLVGGVIFGALFCVSKRFRFSFYATLFLYSVLTLISLVKYKMKGFSLHYYDLIFAGRDGEVVWFLLNSYLHLILPVLFMTGVLGFAAVVLYKADYKSKTGIMVSVAWLVVPMLLLPATYPSEANEDRVSYYLQGRHASAFFVSLLDLEFLFATNNLERRLTQQPAKSPFDTEQKCGREAPDIFVVLSESQANPADFDDIKGGKELEKRLELANGPLSPLTVETFGGGTWITNLSFMTGLPAKQFGWRSPYLTIELEGKVKGSLPSLFAKCGYRTVALLPQNFTFVNEGPFLRSIGFEDVLDKDAIGASHYHMRDKFYFDAAEKIITEHKKNDGRPLFMTIQTMFAHSPYEEKMEPDLVVEGEPFDTDTQVAEYLRRLVIARQDLGEFFETRSKEADDRGVILMDYGDHQSFVTKGFAQQIDGANALSQPGSLAYRTFFTMRFSNPNQDRFFQSQTPVDIAFLGTRLLQFANLPQSEMWSDLARLENLCGGSLQNCPDTGLLDRHQRRRVDSGLLNLVAPKSVKIANHFDPSWTRQSLKPQFSAVVEIPN